MTKKKPNSGIPEDPWSSVDPLGEALHFLNMNGVFYTRSELSAPWGINLPPMADCLMFHIVTSGNCWLEVKGTKPRQIRPGEFALVPRGEGHKLLSAPGDEATPLFDIPRKQISERYELLTHGKGGEATSLICGAVRFDHPAAQQLVQLLPEIIAVDIWHSSQMEWIQSTIRLMAVEAKELKPGGETIITRVADILVIQAIRSWMAEDPTAQTGWLGALQDQQIGKALTLIHRYPARDWTVASLAGEVAMSRSAFAARFKEQLDQSPMNYLAWWRMNVAVKMLKEDAVPLGELGNRLGYQSEAAFNRAFKRFIGVTPGTIRKKALTGEF